MKIGVNVTALSWVNGAPIINILGEWEKLVREERGLVAIGEHVGVGEIGHRVGEVGLGVEQAGGRTIVAHTARRIVTDLHEAGITNLGTFRSRGFGRPTAPAR